MTENHGVYTKDFILSGVSMKSSFIGIWTTKQKENFFGMEEPIFHKSIRTIL